MIRKWTINKSYGWRGIVAALAVMLFQSMGLAHAAKFEFQEHTHHGIPCSINAAVEHNNHLDLAVEQQVPDCTASYDLPIALMAEALARPSLPRETTRAPPAL